MARKKKVKEEEVANVKVSEELLPADIEEIKKWAAKEGQIIDITFYPHMDKWTIAGRAYEHYTTGSGTTLKEAWDRFHDMAATRKP